MYKRHVNFILRHVWHVDTFGTLGAPFSRLVFLKGEGDALKPLILKIKFILGLLEKLILIFYATRR